MTENIFSGNSSDTMYSLLHSVLCFLPVTIMVLISLWGSAFAEQVVLYCCNDEGGFCNGRYAKRSKKVLLCFATYINTLQ